MNVKNLQLHYTNNNRNVIVMRINYGTWGQVEATEKVTII